MQFEDRSYRMEVIYIDLDQDYDVRWRGKTSTLARYNTYMLSLNEVCFKMSLHCSWAGPSLSGWKRVTWVQTVLAYSCTFLSSKENKNRNKKKKKKKKKKILFFFFGGFFCQIPQLKHWGFQNKNRNKKKKKKKKKKVLSLHSGRLLCQTPQLKLWVLSDYHLAGASWLAC